MLGKKPLYKITDYQGKVLLFMYAYSENQMLKDRHQNGLYHYAYFKEQVLSIIKRDYDTVSCIKTMELTTITYLKFLWHNLWAKIEDMIIFIPSLKANSIHISGKSEASKPILYSTNNQKTPNTIDIKIVTNTSELERMEKDGLIYNGCLVGYIHNDNSRSFYVYNNGKFVLLDMDFVSSIIDDSGNVSQDKT